MSLVSSLSLSLIHKLIIQTDLQHSWPRREAPAFKPFGSKWLILVIPVFLLMTFSSLILFSSQIKSWTCALHQYLPKKSIHPSICSWFDPKMLHESLSDCRSHTHTHTFLRCDDTSGLSRRSENPLKYPQSKFEVGWMWTERRLTVIYNHR